MKLGIRLGRESIVQEFEQARRTGIYFRVVQEGVIQAGDAIRLVQKSAYSVTIQDLTDAIAPGFADQGKLRALLALPTLSPTWRERLARLLAQLAGA